MYSLTFDATDTANVGELFFSVVVAGALPVFGSYVVLEEAVYDALFATSALGYIVDQPVNATKIGGTTQTGRDIGASVLLAADQAVNATKFGGTTVTGRDIGASVLLSSGTGAGQLDFTSGVVKANLAQILGTALTETAGQIAAAFKKFFDKASPTGTINSIPDAVAGAASGLALVGSNVGTATSVSGSVGSVTAGVTVTTNNDKTGYGLSSAAVQAVWDALTSALTTAGSIGKWIVDKLDVVVSTRLASASYTAPLDAAGTRSAIGLASANLDTQLSTIDDFLEAELGAIRDRTDNLPDEPASDPSVLTGFSTVNATLATIADYVDTEVGAIKAKTDNLPASPAATSDIPTTDAIAEAVFTVLTSSNPPFPSNTTVIDDFNRADEGPPPSSNWTLGFAAGLEGTTEPGHQVISNEMANTGSDINQNWWNAEQFGPDCEAYITVTNSGSVNALGLAARLTDISGFSSDGYYVHIARTGGGDNRSYQISRIDAGVVTLLASDTETGVGSMTGDKYGIRCLGDSIQLWADTGEGWTMKLSTTDSTYATAGNLGVLTDSSSSSVSRWDDFGGGNVIPATYESPLINLAAIADAVWDEDIVADHTDADTAGKKLSQALILYEGS